MALKGQQDLGGDGDVLNLDRMLSRLNINVLVEILFCKTSQLGETELKATCNPLELFLSTACESTIISK